MMRAWCGTCRKMQPLADQYATDTGDSRPTFTAYVAQPLECGHDANDGGHAPSRKRTVQDPTLVQRLVALQQAARDGVVL